MRKRWNGSLWKRPEPRVMTVQEMRQAIEDGLKARCCDPATVSAVINSNALLSHLARKPLTHAEIKLEIDSL